METRDVLIVGGGPAGSACAWGLRNSGLDVAILDKQKFPRDKICGGWITPAVFSELAIDASEYARGRLLQPITGFRTGSIGGSAICSCSRFYSRARNASRFSGPAIRCTPMQEP